MRILKASLPAGIAAVEFCGKHTVVVSSDLSESDSCAAAALVRSKCNGAFAVAWTRDLPSYAPKASVSSSIAFRAI